MANRSERLINAVNLTSRRRSTRLEPKAGKGVGTGMYCDLSWTNNTPGGQSGPNQPKLKERNVVNLMRRLNKKAS
jgi:hypothetical protein